MMGRQSADQRCFFYDFCLENHVPVNSRESLAAMPRQSSRARQVVEVPDGLIRA